MGSLKRLGTSALALALVASGSLCSQVTYASSGSGDTPIRSTNQRVTERAATYWDAHPGDYEGLSQVINQAGGDHVRFDFPGAGLKNLSGEQAQRAYDHALSKAARATSATPYAIPVNAFSVSSSWYHVRAQDGEWWNFNGNWNFRNAYVNGSAPDDAAGAVVSSLSKTYWKNDGDKIWAADYKGNSAKGATYRKTASFGKSVWAVRDRTSGFKLLTDHGTETISYKRKKNGGSLSNTRGRFYFEHNQDGGGDWSASISLKILSISYGKKPGSRMQKSTGVDYLK